MILFFDVKDKYIFTILSNLYIKIFKININYFFQGKIQVLRLIKELKEIKR